MRNFQIPGRSPVFGIKGAAATSQPLATGVALDILKVGGNAIDAAVAAAATLCVVEPQSTGIGGDCFALISLAGEMPPIAINGSGYAPQAANVNWFKEQGLSSINPQSPHAVTVPGAVRTWARLIEDYGNLSMKELLAPAIDYAKHGYVVAPRIAADWEANAEKLSSCKNASRIFLPDGKPPLAGSIHYQPDLGNALSKIAENGADEFYNGALAEDIVNYLRSLGGLMTIEDFASFKPEYVNPISTNYRGYDIFECPPNGQGVIALMILNILSGFNLSSLDPLGAERFHLEAEACRLAYRDRAVFVADPGKVEVPVDELLSTSYADELRSLINLDHIINNIPSPDLISHKDTVYLSVVDGDGNVVSFINSLFHPFGSGLCTPQTGILLQNRGASFSINPMHLNRIEGRKRPMHTIIPGMVGKDGMPILSFGVMGGHYQACGHAHLLTNMIDYKMDLQTAIDAPRAFHFDGVFELETQISHKVASILETKGHKVCWAEFPIGGAQAISIDTKNKVLTAASEPRKDGLALAW